MAKAIVPTIWKLDHSKSGHFCQDFKWLLTKMATICLDFKWLGFRISNPIQNPDHLQPFSFQPFKIQTSQAIWLSNRHYLSLLFRFFHYYGVWYSDCNFWSDLPIVRSWDWRLASASPLHRGDAHVQLAQERSPPLPQQTWGNVAPWCRSQGKQYRIFISLSRQTISCLDVALKVSNIASLCRSQDKQWYTLMSLSG